MKHVLLAVVLGVTLALALGLPAWAQSGAPSTLTFDGASTTRVKGQLVLGARLTTAGGKPLGEREVEFYQRVDFFGPREAYLGTATTHSDGTAQIAYEPAQTGLQTIVVRFGGGGGQAPASATGSIDVKVAEQAIETESRPLVLVGRYLPFVLGAIVLVTWAALLSIVLGTTSGIRAAARRHVSEAALADAAPAQSAPQEVSR